MLISVLTPCRNEAEHIGRFTANVLSLRLPAGAKLELLIADGASDDGTREKLAALARRHPEIRLLDNPSRATPAALNLAIRASRGEVLVRMDVHTEYAEDYLIECLRALESTGCDNVGGPWVPRGRGTVSEAVALSFQSPWVSGGGKSHDPSWEGPVDTVYLGCWRREAFDRFGLFDESLVRAQDSELNLRILRCGGKLWQSPRIRSWYEPRNSLRDLFRQYSQYGYWKVATLAKHRVPASLRQLVPAAFVSAWIVLAVASFFSRTAGLALGALAVAYALADLGFALALGRHKRSPSATLVMPAVFAAFHFGFGYGYLRGLVEIFLLRRGPSASLTRLTRGSVHPDRA